MTSPDDDRERPASPAELALRMAATFLRKMRTYVLVDGVARPCEDLVEYLEFESDPARRRVIDDDLAHPATGRTGWLSTCFLSQDHNRGGPGPPLLFETMFFGPDDTRCGNRYSTLAEARAGHRAQLAELRLAGWEVVPRPAAGEGAR